MNPKKTEAILRELVRWCDEVLAPCRYLEDLDVSGIDELAERARELLNSDCLED